jgi:hypothetical protein
MAEVKGLHIVELSENDKTIPTLNAIEKAIKW